MPRRGPEMRMRRPASADAAARRPQAQAAPPADGATRRVSNWPAVAFVATIVLSGAGALVTVELSSRGGAERVLHPSGAPFRFGYPARLHQVRRLGATTGVGLDGSDVIFARRGGPEKPAAYEPGKQTRSYERHSGYGMTRLDVTPPAPATALRLYSFHLGSRVWQVDCLWGAAHAAAMRSACAHAVDTISPRGRG